MDGAAPAAPARSSSACPRFGAFRGGGFGDLAARAGEALRRGVRWIVDLTRGLYRAPATS